MSGLRFLCLALFASTVKAAVIPVGDLPSKHVELQAHRGGVGLRPESTLWSFSYGMEIGADVLEMDMVFTKDEIPVIWSVTNCFSPDLCLIRGLSRHDHWIFPEKCNDTTGNFVGKYIANLTLAEVKTLDCGSKQLPAHPQAERKPPNLNAMTLL